MPVQNEKNKIFVGVKPFGQMDKKDAKYRQPFVHKSRTKLPPIEAYEKELEFQAEATGRVQVRLERLMGNSKIRITDSKYMTTLANKLDLEEITARKKRDQIRKENEKDRYRKLAIEGLIVEPSEEFKELENHPVFRVNQILERLNEIDNNLTVNFYQLPPITPTEPYYYYSSNPNDPRHGKFRKEKDFIANSNNRTDCEAKKLGFNRKARQGRCEKFLNSSYYYSRNGHVSRSQGMKQNPNLEYSNTEKVEETATDLQIEQLTEKYSTPPINELEAKYKNYRAPIVQDLFEDSRTARHENLESLFETATEVTNTFEREQMVADDYVNKQNI